MWGSGPPSLQASVLQSTRDCLSDWGIGATGVSLLPFMTRRSRWGESRVELEPITNVNLSGSQLQSYLTHIRLDEINKKLKSGEIFPTYRDRSPSPEPIYDAFGKRVNNREDRYRKKLEDERAKLIEQTIKSNPELNKDIDHQGYLDFIMAKSGKDKRTTGINNGKPSEKVWIPQEEFPNVNFIGLLIGPRGNTLKKMEADSGAKISIRGKGSAKDGRMDSASQAAADEPLHAFISADTFDKVEKAVAIVNKIIEHAASTPEEDNEMKRKQLRELALLNGTLREEENLVCSNCGQTGHRRYECRESRNVTNNLLCRICGGLGHMASDCLHKDNPEMLEMSRQRAEHIDNELTSFLNEIGDRAQRQPEQQVYAQTPQTPWGQPDPNAAAAPWAQPDPATYQYAYPPANPWAMPPPPPPPQQ